MTRNELSVLEVLVNEFRDFRRQDSSWKTENDRRLRLVEAYIAGEEAVEEREEARGVSRRAYLASAIAAIGIVVSIILGIVNFLV